MKLTLGPFRGIAPKVPAELLPEGFAQRAENCLFLDGALAAMPGPGNVLRGDGTENPALTGKTDHSSIFRFGDETVDGLYWGSFGPYTNIVRGFVVDAQKEKDDQRYYFTGDQWPRIITYGAAKTGIDANAVLSDVAYSNNLGVPAPKATPTVRVEGVDGDDVFVTNYFYTYVVGDVESVRSPIVSVSTVPHVYPQSDNDPYPVNLTFPVPPAEVDSMNIYRYADKLPAGYAGDTTNKSGHLVAAIDDGQLTYKDTNPDVTAGPAYSVTELIAALPVPVSPIAQATVGESKTEEIAFVYRIFHRTRKYGSGFDVISCPMSQSVSFETTEGATNTISFNPAMTADAKSSAGSFYGNEFQSSGANFGEQGWYYDGFEIYRKVGEGFWFLIHRVPHDDVVDQTMSIEYKLIAIPYAEPSELSTISGVKLSSYIEFQSKKYSNEWTVKYTVPAPPPKPVVESNYNDSAGERTYAVCVVSNFAETESTLSAPVTVDVLGGQDVELFVHGVSAQDSNTHGLTKKRLYRKVDGTWRLIWEWNVASLEAGQKIIDPLIPMGGYPNPPGDAYTNSGVAAMLTVGSPEKPPGAICDLQLGTGEIRLYVTTFVSSLSEEGPPSPASEIVTVYRGQKVFVENLTIDASDSRSSDFDVVGRRIYRYSATGSAGGEFYRCDQGYTDASGVFRNFLPVNFPINGQPSAFENVTSFEDVVKSDENLGVVCPSTTWYPPPTNLSGLCVVSNGILSGFEGQRLYFCEPWRAHAWPPEYMKDTMAKIKAIVATGDALVVLTSERPILLRGAHPASMQMVPLDFEQSIVAPMSATRFMGGAVYSSPDGLCFVSSGSSPMILTEPLFDHETWNNAGWAEQSLIVKQHDNRIYGFVGSSGFLFDPAGKSFSTLNFGVPVTAMFNLLTTDKLYVLVDGVLKKAESGDPLTYTYRSKVFVSPRTQSLAWAKVIAEDYASVTFKLIIDDADALTGPVISDRPFRLPPIPGKRFEIELTGTSTVLSVSAASSLDELNG